MTELPADVDPELWFFSQRCGGRDYLYDAHWHTHPGRMAVFCPHDPLHPGYRISKSELPAELPEATRYFVAGFLAGNLPPHPFEEGVSSSVAMEEWTRAADRFASEGVWHVEVDMNDPWRQVQATFREYAALLSRIGATLEEQVPLLNVRLPLELADAARQAADRDHVLVEAKRDELALERAAALVHIGQRIAEAGVRDEAAVTLELEVALVGEALTASLERW